MFLILVEINIIHIRLMGLVLIPLNLCLISFQLCCQCLLAKSFKSGMDKTWKIAQRETTPGRPVLMCMRGTPEKFIQEIPNLNAFILIRNMNWKERKDIKLYLYQRHSTEVARGLKWCWWW